MGTNELVIELRVQALYISAMPGCEKARILMLEAARRLVQTIREEKSTSRRDLPDGTDLMR